jgi:GGDEF domain-containing protein
MERKMNNQNDSVRILNDMSEDEILDPEPVEFWILQLYLFVFVQNKNDENPLIEEGKFVLLEYPSYNNLIDNKPNSCIWSSPYQAIKINTDVKRPSRVKDILKLYEDELKRNEKIIKILEKYYFYKLGIPMYNTHPGRHYIEYKNSSRQQGVMKCYYIQENYIDNIDNIGFLNLLDPEGLHHYRYYLIKPEYSNNIKNIFFDGKPLASNITKFIVDNYSNFKLIPVDIKMLIRQFDGYIFKFDICGSTNALRIIEANFLSFERTGQEYGDDFIVRLGFIMEKELRNADILQYHIEGDGFLATVPSDHKSIEELIELIKKIIGNIDNFIKTIHILNNDFSYRFVLMKEKYKYGKNYGLYSTQLTHMGPAFIKAARMEQCVKESISTESKSKKLYLGIQESIYNENKNYFEASSFKYIKLEKKFRETEVNTVILFQGEKK